MRVLYQLFLTLGLTTWPLRRKAERRRYILWEPDTAQRDRRNILALSGVVALAGLAGGDPQDLSPFGVRFSPGIRSVLALGIAVIGAQLYWYVMRYLHLRDEGFLRIPQTSPDRPLRDETDPSFARKGVDLIANWTAFVLTLLSWTFIAYWIAGSP